MYGVGFAWSVPESGRLSDLLPNAPELAPSCVQYLGVRVCGLRFRDQGFYVSTYCPTCFQTPLRSLLPAFRGIHSFINLLCMTLTCNVKPVPGYGVEGSSFRVEVVGAVSRDGCIVSGWWGALD